MQDLKWIGVDWGTSNLRAFAMGADATPLDENSSARGMGTLKPHEFEPALLEVIGPWLPANRTIPVYACGMVGARQGWREADYRTVPCAPVSQAGLTRVDTRDPRLDVHILPGLSQSDPADVMRGEETQLAGYLSAVADFSGVICLPGTHSKWVEIKEGQVAGFQTFMTGELYSVLSNHSVLRHSLSDIGLDRDVFMRVALETVAAPLSPVVNMFGLRASALLHGQSPQAASARLSGMLIGQEIGVIEESWTANPVVLIGATDVVGLYHELLSRLGADVTTMAAAQATLFGLQRAARKMKEN